MKLYSIRLRFGMMFKDMHFEIEDDGTSDEKWLEARKGLDAVGDSCTEDKEFLEKAAAHFASYGFRRIRL